MIDVPWDNDAELSEAEFQRIVVQLAVLRGWWWWHDNSRRKNTKGFLDLVLLRERLIWVELKREKGSALRPEQVEMIERLRAAGQEVHVWRPGDWETIAYVLARPKRS